MQAYRIHDDHVFRSATDAIECGLPMRPQVHQFVRNSRAMYFNWTRSSYSKTAYLSIIGTVSMYDFVLTILYAPYLKYMEENPVGRWLMFLDQIRYDQTPDLSLFLSAKAIGTILVLLILYWMVTKRIKHGHPVAIGVSMFQLFLAAKLTFGT